jgi:hypothetical protein
MRLVLFAALLACHAAASKDVCDSVLKTLSSCSDVSSCGQVEHLRECILLFPTVTFDNANLTEPVYGRWLFDEESAPVCTSSGGNAQPRWIVITSIAPPTDAVKAWAALPGWKVVVVGDVKTPRDWSLPGVDFISYHNPLPSQKLLADVLPAKNYARKMLGYLHAIACGAQLIYETDDDNAPKPDMGLSWIRDPPVANFNLLVTTDTGAVNPYAYFGECQIWPRGFPLNDLVSSETGLSHCFAVSADKATLPLSVPIQQGLADEDPDVDAIWRLLHPERIGKVHFNHSKPPLVLGANTLSPYNTQNTAHFQSAFWAMFIPPGVDMRVCDIWRSYWAQRLLWEQQSNLLFAPPTVDQVRNAHDYTLDFKAEAQLYTQAHVLVDFLQAWSCDHTNLFDCMLQLGYDMARHGFWSALDVRTLTTWIESLLALGYAPSRAFQPAKQLTRSSKRVAVMLFGQDRASEVTLPSQLRYLVEPFNADLYAVLSENSDGVTAPELASVSKMTDFYTQPDLNALPCDRAKNLTGNFLGGAAGHSGSGLHLIYNKERIRNMIHSHQLDHVYDWFVFSRTDFLYLGTHYDFRSEEPCCLIPLGMDWGGYNDRHMVCHKRFAKAALRQLAAITNNSHAVWNDLANNPPFDLNSETFLLRCMTLAGIPVKRFSPTFFLTASPETSTRWSTAHLTGASGLLVKYDEEFELALRSAGIVTV